MRNLTRLPILALPLLLVVSACEGPTVPLTEDDPAGPKAAPTTHILNSTGCTVGFAGTVNTTSGHTSHGNTFTACTTGTLTGIELEYGDSPCTKSFTATANSSTGKVLHGNSFAPCATGEVTSIEIEYWGTAAPGRTLRIYQGQLPTATLIYTQTGVLLDGGTDFDAITLTSSVTLQRGQVYTFTVDVPSPVRFACSVAGGVGAVFDGTPFPTCGIGYKVHTTTADATGLTLSLFTGNTVGGSAAYTQAGVTLDGSYGFDPITLSTPFPVVSGSQYTFLLDVPAPVGYACGVGNGESAYFSGTEAAGCNVGYRAHFSPTVTTVTVDVDIKPGGDPNCVNPGSKGRLPIAVMGSASFDPANVDPSTVTVGGASPLRWSLKKDVDGDGYQDLVFHFSTREVAAAGVLTEGNTLLLTGELLDGTPFEGSDVVYLAGGPTCLD